MGKPKTVAYAVLNGRDETKGIFTDWTECSHFVTGVKCANFKGCISYVEAKSILQNAGINPRCYEEGHWFSCTDYEKKNGLLKHGSVVTNEKERNIDAIEIVDMTSVKGMDFDPEPEDYFSLAEDTSDDELEESLNYSKLILLKH